MCGEYFRLCKLLMLDADPVERGLWNGKSEMVVNHRVMLIDGRPIVSLLTYTSTSDCHSVPPVSCDFAYVM